MLDLNELSVTKNKSTFQNGVLPSCRTAAFNIGTCQRLGQSKDL